MATARMIDPNGFLSVRGSRLSSFGIFDYTAEQIGLEGGDPHRIVKVYRPESALQEPDAIESFKIVPFIVDHEMLSGNDDSEGTAPEEKGIDGVLTNVHYASPWLLGDLKIFSRKAQDALQSGKSDLSLGYRCDFKLESGTFDGEPYEAIQYKMRGNHIALVDRGRVPGACVADGFRQAIVYDHLSFVKPSTSTKDNAMATPTKGKTSKKIGDNAVEQLKALLPALEQFLNEEAQEPQHQDNSEGEAPEASANPTEQQAAPTAPSEENESDTEMNGENELSGIVAKLKEALAALQAQSASSAGGTGDTEEGAEDNEMAEQGEDGEEKIEGLTPESKTGDDGEASAISNNGKASPGPAKGVHSQAGDSALTSFYRDAAAKNRIYDRVSKVVGAFDHASLTSGQVAATALKKLNLTAPKGAELAVLDAYLLADEKARKDVHKFVKAARAGDSAVAETTKGMSEFLQSVA